MTDKKLCDRCGKQINSWQSIYYHTTRDRSELDKVKYPIGFDLCWDCIKALNDWLNYLEKNQLIGQKKEIKV